MCQKPEYIYNGIYLKSKMIKVIHESSCVIVKCIMIMLIFKG